MTKEEIRILRPYCTKMKSIAHPHRLAILSMLSETESMLVGDIMRSLNSRPPDTTLHLKLMKASGFVTSKKVGRNMYYSMTEENKANLKELAIFYHIH